MCAYQSFDIESWDRRDAFRFFAPYNDPFFGITGNVDATQLYAYCKREGVSFFLMCLYCSLRAANSIMHFRLRILNSGKVVLFDEVYAGSAVLHDDDTLGFCYFPYHHAAADFEREGRAIMQAQKESRKLEPREHEVGLIHYSVIPWVSFTHFKNPKRMSGVDSIPKIVFGKTFPEGDALKMPLAVEVNHALMDGVHVGMFFANMQKEMDAISK
jgi:chloramphenicol O-acetyltransferase type A